jgi:hypothetical protein
MNRRAQKVVIVTGSSRAGFTRRSRKPRTVDGLSIFYREAGPKDAPLLLLLHGHPLTIIDRRTSRNRHCDGLLARIPVGATGRKPGRAAACP